MGPEDLGFIKGVGHVKRGSDTVSCLTAGDCWLLMTECWLGEKVDLVLEGGWFSVHLYQDLTRMRRESERLKVPATLC